MTILERVLRYVGLDQETRLIRRTVKNNWQQAEETLNQISDRLVDSRRSVASNREISRAIRNSEYEIEEQRRRTVRA